MMLLLITIRTELRSCLGFISENLRAEIELESVLVIQTRLFPVCCYVTCYRVVKIIPKALI